MGNKLSAPTDGEEPKSATQVIGDVLAENTKKNQILQNVGIGMHGQDQVNRTLRPNWKQRRGQMLSFVYKWLICQRKSKNMRRKGSRIKRR